MGWRLLRRAYLPVSLALLLAAALLVRLPAFLELPGEAQSLAGRVQVGVEQAAEVDGEYLFTAVTLRRATLVTLVAALTEPTVDVVPRAQVIPPGVDDEAFFERQRAIFQESASVAAAVALAAAGFDVDPTALTGDGVQVGRVVPGAPADGALEPGDVIVAVNGTQVRTTADLASIMERLDDDEPRRFTFRRDGRLREVELVPTELRAPQGTFVGVGIEIQTLDPRIDLPVEVSIDSGDVGGPSAGLMIALMVYDLVTPDEDLAAGRRIAGTGTLDAQGRVGGVGGVVQKVVAAAADEVDVFLVPAEQLEGARQAMPADSSMRLHGVATFAEALQVLRSQAAAGLPDLLVRAGQRPWGQAA